ncbi:MAG TPA: flagellar export chaperone FlgN [Lacipirellula sp.]
MTEHSTTVLAGLMSKRRKCLEQLRELGRRQAAHIAGGEMTELLRLVAAKEQLIVAMQAIERQLAPFQAEAPESRDWESAASRAQCAADAEACRALIEEVMAMEQAGEQQMTVRRDAVSQQLRVAAQGGRVREAYGANR